MKKFTFYCFLMCEEVQKKFKKKELLALLYLL